MWALAWGASKPTPSPQMQLGLLSEAVMPPPPHPAAGTYKELMDYLSRDRSMAQMQLGLLSEERNRLRTERDAADRTAAELRAQYNDVQNTMHQARQDLQVWTGCGV